MWEWLLAVIVIYTLLWITPFWLVWPLGVLVSLYLVTIIQKARDLEITDTQILVVLIGSWCSLCYGLWVFFIR